MPSFVYHGTTADMMDILIHGLTAREDREGVSVTTKEERAEWWGGLKRGPVQILRIPKHYLTKMIPENAFPADPKTDFTTDRTINPLFIQARNGANRWVSMIDLYGELLDEGEMERWKRKWLHGMSDGPKR